ncbi:hypothetical protein [Ktedonosporobacter rubrisoli]|nr:hypothetical protein [Ktedonosporobacter rubrisoli]
MEIGVIGLKHIGTSPLQAIYAILTWKPGAARTQKGAAKRAKLTYSLLPMMLISQDSYMLWIPAKAGHFVQTMHNDTGYGMLQAYGEGFQMLKASLYGLGLYAIAHLWKRSGTSSWLLELVGNVGQKVGKLEAIKGYVEISGESQWTAQQAIDTGVPAPASTLSLLRRFRIRQNGSFMARAVQCLIPISKDRRSKQAFVYYYNNTLGDFICLSVA